MLSGHVTSPHSLAYVITDGVFWIINFEVVRFKGCRPGSRIFENLVSISLFISSFLDDSYSKKITFVD